MTIADKCIIAVLLFVPAAVFAAEPTNCRTSVRFSSEGSVSKVIDAEIGNTRARLLLAMYGFDDAGLAEELIGLAKKGVDVRLKIDTARSAGKKITALMDHLKAGGVAVQTVAPDGRNHNKFAVIDGATVLTGSYNWTVKSEGNWENLLILNCAAVAVAYEREWERIK